MHDTTYLYVLIVDEIKDYLDFKDYDLSNIDKLNDDMLEIEDDVKETILLNNDFDWYDEKGREQLCDAVLAYKGGSFENLSKALQDENETAELIFRLVFDEACNDLLEDYITELKGEC